MAAITDKSKGKINFEQVEGTLLFKLLFKRGNIIFFNIICFRIEERAPSKNNLTNRPRIYYSYFLGLKYTQKLSLRKSK